MKDSKGKLNKSITLKINPPWLYDEKPSKPEDEYLDTASTYLAMTKSNSYIP